MNINCNFNFFGKFSYFNFNFFGKISFEYNVFCKMLFTYHKLFIEIYKPDKNLRIQKILLKTNPNDSLSGMVEQTRYQFICSKSLCRVTRIPTNRYDF